MKTIPMDKILKASMKTGVPYQTLAKRKVNYREPNKTKILKGEICKHCQLRRKMPYPEGTRQQCEIIGTGINLAADINLQYTCDYQKK
jgi:hypothetical protein